MSRGFIKRIGGNVRMRFVKSGFDANNMSLPANAVVFDSDATKYLKVYMSGSYRVNSGTGEVTVATFPSLGYIPFVYAIFRRDSLCITPEMGTSDLYVAAATFVTLTTLRVETRSMEPYPVNLDYIIFRASSRG